MVEALLLLFMLSAIGLVAFVLLVGVYLIEKFMERASVETSDQSSDVRGVSVHEDCQ